MCGKPCDLFLQAADQGCVDTGRLRRAVEARRDLLEAGFDVAEAVRRLSAGRGVEAARQFLEACVKRGSAEAGADG